MNWNDELELEFCWIGIRSTRSKVKLSVLSDLGFGACEGAGSRVQSGHAGTPGNLRRDAATNQ